MRLILVNKLFNNFLTTRSVLQQEYTEQVVMKDFVINAKKHKVQPNGLQEVN